MPFHPVVLVLVIPVGLIIAVATGSPPPDLTGIAAIITACIGVVGFLATLFRGKANNKRVEEVEQAAGYVKGFDALVKRLQDEIADTRKESATEKQKWSDERTDLEGQISELRTRLVEGSTETTQVRAELLLLKGQIRGFLTVEQWKEFQRHLDR